MLEQTYKKYLTSEELIIIAKKITFVLLWILYIVIAKG